MNTVFLDKEGNVRKPQTWEEVKNSVCRWDSCEPCSYSGGHSRTGGGFECTHPLRPQPEKPENPVIVQLKKELDEARECELAAQTLNHSIARIEYWKGYQAALRRAIEIVGRMK